MSGMLAQIHSLIRKGAVRISDHGYDELAADAISVRDVIAGLPGAVVVEEYPEFPKGPCLLALQRDRDGRPVHVVWGIAKGAVSPAVLVTAYRPDPKRWTEDYLTRKP